MIKYRTYIKLHTYSSLKFRYFHPVLIILQLLGQTKVYQL